MVDDLARQLQTIVQRLEFVEEARQRALVRALETYAKEKFAHDDFTLDDSTAWARLLDYLKIERKLFINPNFIAEQLNLPVLAVLRKGILPACNCNAIQFPLDLQNNETLWWRFADVRMEQLQPQHSKQTWSVAMHILQSSLPSKPKKAVEHKELGTGTLWITDQFIHFEQEQRMISFAHQEIYALTPEVDGVTVQRRELQTRPQTFRCEEGRLLYEFLRFAQSLK